MCSGREKYEQNMMQACEQSAGKTLVWVVGCRTIVWIYHSIFFVLVVTFATIDIFLARVTLKKFRVSALFRVGGDVHDSILGNMAIFCVHHMSSTV